MAFCRPFFVMQHYILGQNELITVAAKIEVDQDELQEKLQSTTKEAHKLKEVLDRVEKAMGVLALRGEKNSKTYDELNDLSKKLRGQQKDNNTSKGCL